MRTDIPEDILASSHDLNPDGLVQLFRLQLTNGALFLISPQKEVTWQGETYEKVPCALAGVGSASDGRAVRPRFSFVNPEGIFTVPIYEGQLENAELTRIRILRNTLEADQDFAIRETYWVRRIMNLTKNLVVTELRDILDGQNFKIPARQYMPPEFTHVRLQ